MDAVILAGGQGTRLRPLTETTPKPLLPFMGEPFAAGLLRRLVDVGVRRATFLVGADPEPWAPLQDIGLDVGVTVAVSAEELPLDTAGAARRFMARGLDDAVLVCNGDILTDLDFAAVLRAHRDAGAAATIVLTRVSDTSAFGVVVCDQDGRVERFVEKPPPGTLDEDTVNAGTYILSPDVFSGFPGDGPLSFERTVFPGLVQSGALVAGVSSDRFWADLGTPARYLAGHLAVLEERCRWPAAPGMRRQGPVAIHQLASVADGAWLGRGTVVGASCRIEAGARIDGSVLHDGVVVGAGATVTAAILGAGSRVAPGGQMAPGSVLGEGAVSDA
jgi:NDP-sugar pyrophosphorylase family protein